MDNTFILQTIFFKEKNQKLKFLEEKKYHANTSTLYKRRRKFDLIKDYSRRRIAEGEPKGQPETSGAYY